MSYNKLDFESCWFIRARKLVDTTRWVPSTSSIASRNYEFFMFLCEIGIMECKDYKNADDYDQAEGYVILFRLNPNLTEDKLQQLINFYTL
jgi:hypothetical protein